MVKYMLLMVTLRLATIVGLNRMPTLVVVMKNMMRLVAAMGVDMPSRTASMEFIMVTGVAMVVFECL